MAQQYKEVYRFVGPDMWSRVFCLYRVRVGFRSGAKSRRVGVGDARGGKVRTPWIGNRSCGLRYLKKHNKGFVYKMGFRVEGLGFRV